MRARGKILAGAAALVLVASVAIGCSQQEEPAQGALLTKVTNVGSGSIVVDGGGRTVWLGPQQSAWNVSRIIVQTGTCVSVNGAKAVCSGNIYLGPYNYLARRTK